MLAKFSCEPETLPSGLSVELFDLDTDKDIALSSAEEMLNPVEKSRAARFSFPEGGARYTRGRGFVRRALGQRLGIAPSQVPLSQGEHEKPSLSCAGPNFNLSHSGGLAVLALSEIGPVGIDLECADRNVNVGLVSPACMTPPELAVLDRLAAPERQSRFLLYWTAKEALMKLTGEGMALPAKSIELVLEDGLPTGYAKPFAHKKTCLFRPNFGIDRFVSIAWAGN